MPPPRVSVTPEGEILVLARAPRAERWSWALYDFANTIFSMNIVTLYFAVWIVTERGASNTAYSVATSLSSLLVLGLAPVFGAFSDASRRRKPWVISLTLLSVAGTVALAPLANARLPQEKSIFLLLAAFAAANTAYQLAIPPYNAMLPELVPAGELGRMSGFGTALGYVGSIVGVLLVAPFVTGRLGLPAGGRQAAFVPTALFFLLFSLPFFVFCRDHLAWLPAQRRPGRIGSAVDRARRRASRHPAASWSPALRPGDVVLPGRARNGVSFMALYAVTVLGLPPGAEIRRFVVLTIPAIAGSSSPAAPRTGSARSGLSSGFCWAGWPACLRSPPPRRSRRSGPLGVSWVSCLEESGRRSGRFS